MKTTGNFNFVYKGRKNGGVYGRLIPLNSFSEFLAEKDGKIISVAFVGDAAKEILKNLNGNSWVPVSIEEIHPTVIYDRQSDKYSLHVLISKFSVIDPDPCKNPCKELL